MVQYPKITLQIVHDHAALLEKCMDSVLDLDYPNLSIHLIGDASKNDRMEGPTLPDDKKIHIQCNTKKSGRVENSPADFSQTSDTEWFINLSSHCCFINKTGIREVVEIIMSNPDDQILHVQSNLLQHISLEKINPLKSYSGGYYLIRGIDYLKLCLEYDCFSLSGSIFNVAMLRQFGGFENDGFEADIFTAMRIAIQGQVLIGSKDPGYWQEDIDEGSATGYSEEEYQKSELAYCRFFEWCEDYLSYPDIRKLIMVHEKRELEKKLALRHSKSHSLFNSLLPALRDKRFNPAGISEFLYKLIPSLPGSSMYKNIGHGLMSKGISVALNLIMIPLILHQIGVENYGWVGVYSTIISALFVFDFGISSIVTKEISQSSYESKKSLVGSLELIYYCIGLLIFIGLWAGSTALSSKWFAIGYSGGQAIWTIRLISLAVFFQWPHTFYSGALYGFGRQVLSNNLQLGASILRSTVLILFCLTGHLTIFHYFAVQILVSMITSILLKCALSRAVLFWNPFRYFSITKLRLLKDLALGITLVSIFGFIYSDLNNILLSKWLSLHDFGLYNIGYNIIGMVILLTSTIKNSLFPEIAESVHISSLDTRQTRYRGHFNAISYICIPICIFFMINSREVLRLWLQDEHLAILIDCSMKWISAGCLFYSLFIIPWAYLISLNKTGYLIFLTATMAIVSVPLLFQLVSAFGFEGGSIYWCMINMLPSLALLFYVQYTLFRNPFFNIYRGLAIPLFSSISIFGTYAAFRLRFEWNDLINIFLIVTSILSVYAILFRYHFKRAIKTGGQDQ